ncbi:hypothetical protein GCM10010913_08820 [Paenibacillus aceti]|uniref:Uncharacterized protein n=1 Tax=Paenibacillus aceti TaxID=1820010 RepID=A0ABQ1VSA1_9BACL|nr:hypothetical protein GCM10010913_08820 [Paenibacillus aceti]
MYSPSLRSWGGKWSRLLESACKMGVSNGITFFYGEFLMKIIFMIIIKCMKIISTSS